MNAVIGVLLGTRTGDSVLQRCRCRPVHVAPGPHNGWPWLDTAQVDAGRVGSVGLILNHNAVSKVASVKCHGVAIAGRTCQRTPDCQLAM